jgi:hypothetical protein
MCVTWKTWASIKLPFFLIVPISLKKISFNSVTWYGSDHGGFVGMFANPTYLHIYDNEFDGEKANEDHSKKPWVVDMCRLMTLDDTSPMCKKKRIATNLQVHPPPQRKRLLD